MFFNLAWRNSKRSRNENLIYFLTMVTAVAAFYIVLSLGAQAVSYTHLTLPTNSLV